MKIAGLEIRKVILATSLVIALMLFQTPKANLGTITSLASMGLLILSCIASTKDVQYNCKEKKLLLFFIVFFNVFAIIYGCCEFYDLLKTDLQIIICILLYSFSGNRDESHFIRRVFEIATTIYAILIIYSCLKAGTERYIHAKIELFGTTFDPNYLGIPLVFTTALLLNDILMAVNKKGFVLWGVFYLINVVAIIETSSRGNFVAFAIANGFCILNYLKGTRSSFRKYFVLFIVFLAAGYFLVKVSSLLGDNIERMTTFGDDADNGRFDIWNSSIDIFVSSPLWGGGFGSVNSVVGFVSHNTFLMLLSETGLIGFIVFGLFLWKMLRKAYEFDKTIGIALVAMYIQICFINVIDNKCFWAIMYWVALLPREKVRLNQIYA